MFNLANAYFALVLAHWAAIGRLPADICMRGFKYHEQVDANFRGSFRKRRLKEFPAYRQCVALALWRVGQSPEALHEIEEADTTVRCESESTLYESPWRNREEVTREQFLGDCDQILRPS